MLLKSRSNNNSKTCQNIKVLLMGLDYIQNVSTGWGDSKSEKKIQKVPPFKNYKGLSMIPSFRHFSKKLFLPKFFFSFFIKKGYIFVVILRVIYKVIFFQLA